MSDEPTTVIYTDSFDPEKGGAGRLEVDGEAVTAAAKEPTRQEKLRAQFDRWMKWAKTATTDEPPEDL